MTTSIPTPHSSGPVECILDASLQRPMKSDGQQRLVLSANIMSTRLQERDTAKSKQVQGTGYEVAVVEGEYRGGVGAFGGCGRLPFGGGNESPPILK